MATVQCERRGAVALVTLNRPAAKNAMRRQEMELLAATLGELRKDKEVRACVLTGAGGAFCAGIDLTAAVDVFNGPLFRDYVQQGYCESDPMFHMERAEFPIIAAVDGVCFTGGLEIALACDVILASPRAVFCDTHAKFGIMPFWGLSQKLQQHVGPGRARLMSLAAEPCDAATAEKWGLAAKVVPQDKLVAEALRIAGAMATSPLHAVQGYKRLISIGSDASQEHKEAPAVGRAEEFKAAMSFYGGPQFKAVAKMMARGVSKKGKL